MNSNFVNFLTENNQLFIIIFSGISSTVAAIALIVSIVSNIVTKKQYKKSLEPQLSMKLECFDNDLYLLIENTGKSPAFNISIVLNKIENNGEFNVDKSRILFAQNFDLFPNEEVQDYINVYGKNMVVDAFPVVYLNVSYENNKGAYVKYTRTVNYCRAYNKKVYADVNIDLNETNRNLKSISRASLRTANYFDGKNLASFDEIDVLSDRSLKDDFIDILNGATKSNVLSREETLDEALKERSKRKDC